MRAVLLPVAAAGALLMTAGPALAHTSLVSTTPAAGAVVAAEVGSVTLVFSQPVLSSQALVVVSGPDGADRADGPAQVSGGTVSQPVGPVPTSGSHRLAYRVLAEDGHPITGEVSFQVEQAAAPAAAVPPPVAAAPAEVTTASSSPGGGGWAPALAVGLGVVSVAFVAAAVRARRPGVDG